MFANATFKVDISQRVVATLVASAVLLATVGYHSIAQAANLIDVRDTLSDSDLNTASNHTIEFTMSPTGSVAASGGTITVTFDPDSSGFNFGSVAVGDIDLSINGSNQTLVAGAAGAGNWGYTRAGNVITFTAGSGVSASANNPIIIRIGTNATGGTNRITNPNASGSVELYITAGTQDTGRTRVAIIDNVLVTAIVETTFDFTITGLATSSPVNGTTTTGDTSATLVDFGILVAGQIKTLAQRLNVETNARNGFVVTAETDGDLESSNGAIIDVFDEASDVSEANVVWNSPVPDVYDETTWGHWGITTTDGDLSSLGGYYATEFAANEYIAASTTPREVFHHDGPADGVTNNVGSTTVGYQVEITALQEAADDYNTTLTYIATPTF